MCQPLCQPRAVVPLAPPHAPRRRTRLVHQARPRGRLAAAATVVKPAWP